MLLDTIHHSAVTKTANVSSANVYARPPGYTSKRSSAVLNNSLSWTRRGFGKLLAKENPRSVVQVVNLYLEIAERKPTTPFFKAGRITLNVYTVPVMSIVMITSLNTIMLIK